MVTTGFSKARSSSLDLPVPMLFRGLLLMLDSIVAYLGRTLMNVNAPP